ncbi:MAG: cytochrome c [Verrucomicrobiales bacterium]|nr:cytochrome c [Verrucomicrobiales bacterium]
MSDESHESNSPFVSILGNVFLVLVPLALIVMLGIVGAAFVKGVREEPVKPEEVVAAAAPVAAPAAEAAAPAEVAKTDAAAPAAKEAAAEAPAAAPEAKAAAIDPAVMAMGQASYAMCAACHGPDGAGLKAGPALMAPSFHGSETLLGDPDIPLLVVLKGIAKENMDYMGMMAPLGAGLDDEKLAAVLTYVRNSWGNSAPAVTAEQAAAARAKFAEVNAPAGVKRGELQAIVDAHK